MGSFCQVLSYDVIRCTFESLDSRVKNVFPLHRWKATWRKMVQKCRCGLEGPTCGQKWDFTNSVRTPHFNKWGQNSHGARTECWQLTFLETTYTFTFVSVIHNIEHFNMTRDITFTLYHQDLTFISRGRGVGGGDTGRMAAKPVTTVQDCVSVFASESPLDTF